MSWCSSRATLSRGCQRQGFQTGECDTATARYCCFIYLCRRHMHVKFHVVLCGRTVCEAVGDIRRSFLQPSCRGEFVTSCREFSPTSNLSTTTRRWTTVSFTGSQMLVVMLRTAGYILISADIICRTICSTCCGRKFKRYLCGPPYVHAITAQNAKPKIILDPRRSERLRLWRVPVCKIVPGHVRV